MQEHLLQGEDFDLEKPADIAHHQIDFHKFIYRALMVKDHLDDHNKPVEISVHVGQRQGVFRSYCGKQFKRLRAQAGVAEEDFFTSVAEEDFHSGT